MLIMDYHLTAAAYSIIKDQRQTIQILNN